MFVGGEGDAVSRSELTEGGTLRTGELFLLVVDRGWSLANREGGLEVVGPRRS